MKPTHMLEITKEVTPVLRRLKSLMQAVDSLALIISGIKKLDEKVLTHGETSARFSRVRLGPIRTDQKRWDLRQIFDLCCSYVKIAPVQDPDFIARLEFATHGSIGRSIEFCHSAILQALRRRDGHLTLDDFWPCPQSEARVRRCQALRSGGLAAAEGNPR